MQQLLQRTSMRIALALAALVVVGGAAAAYYLFGAGGTTPKAATLAVPTLAASKNGVIFTIDPSASQATFTISEVLLGQSNTVVGKTDQVTGQFMVDRVDPARSMTGLIRVDLSSLVTDNDFRNRALQNRILETNIPGNQYAVFSAQSLTGLPTSASGLAIGQTLSFQATGSLIIHQVTRTVTFTVRVTIASDQGLTGRAQTTIKYADYNNAMPQVPSVTNVSDDVVLALTFSAHM